MCELLDGRNATRAGQPGRRLFLDLHVRRTLSALAASVAFRQIRAAHEAMRGLLEAAEPDEEAILAQADAIGALRTELDKDRLVTLLRIRARLSPEQREPLTQQLEARKPRGGREKGPATADSAASLSSAGSTRAGVRAG